jgi:uracil-DNA glycosylase
MNKKDQLDKIAREIKNCKSCKVGKSGLAVPGEGNPDADIIFIGEAPGRKEAESGTPFVGRSGQLLRSLIREAGLKEQDVFITSPVKYLPDRGTPAARDIKHGMIHLKRQLEIINPQIIVLLGNVAVQGVLGNKIPVKKEHGKVIKKEGLKYLVTLHPAAAIRFPPLRLLIKKDFNKLKKLVKSP